MRQRAIMNASPLPLPPLKARRRSVSQQTYERFGRHETRRKCVAILYTVIYLVYLRWRFSITLNSACLGHQFWNELTFQASCPTAQDLITLTTVGSVADFMLKISGSSTMW